MKEPFRYLYLHHWQNNGFKDFNNVYFANLFKSLYLSYFLSFIWATIVNDCICVAVWLSWHNIDFLFLCVYFQVTRGKEVFTLDLCDSHHKAVTDYSQGLVNLFFTTKGSCDSYGKSYWGFFLPDTIAQMNILCFFTDGFWRIKISKAVVQKYKTFVSCTCLHFARVTLESEDFFVLSLISLFRLLKSLSFGADICLTLCSAHSIILWA